MSSRAPETWDWLPRRKIARAPDEFSAKMPLPREDAEFHAPLLCPSETTRPSGFPSGVKKLALMASGAAWLCATDWEDSNTEPGPSGWSMTRRRWVRESKETPSKDIPRIVFLARRGWETGVVGASGAAAVAGCSGSSLRVGEGGGAVEFGDCVGRGAACWHEQMASVMKSRDLGR